MKEFLKNVPNSLKYPAEYIAYFFGGHPVYAIEGQQCYSLIGYCVSQYDAV